MNLKNPKGFRVVGKYIDLDLDEKVLFIVLSKAKDKLTFVYDSYLDVWYAGHAAHTIKGKIVKEGDDFLEFEAIDGRGTLSVKPLDDDAFVILLDELKVNYEEEYKKMNSIYGE